MAGHAIVTQAAPVSDGTQDFSRSGLGTPLGYLLFGGQVTTLNTDIDDFALSVGAADFTSEAMGFSGSEHNQATSDSRRIYRSDEVLRIATAGDSAANEQCSDNGAITDGMQVDWTATDVARQCSAIIFQEGIANFDVQSPSLNGTGATVVTTGFEPDIVIAFSPDRDNENGSNEAHWSMSFYDVSGDSYHGVMGMAGDGSTTPVSAERFDETNIVGFINNVGNVFQTWTLGSFTSTGFTATKAAGSAARNIIFVSISLSAGYSFSIGTVNAPTSTGVDSILSGLDHEPQIALFAGCGQTAAGQSSGQCSVGFGACTEDDEFSIGGAIRDFGSANNSDASSHHHDDATIYITDDAGTVISEGAFSAFQSDGVDINFSTADTGVALAYLTIGPVPVSAAPMMNKMMQEGHVNG